MNKKEMIKILVGKVRYENLNECEKDLEEIAAWIKDAETVKHAYWIPHDEIKDPKYKCVLYGEGYGQCSHCKSIVWLAVTNSGAMKFCPQCGAKMDEKDVKLND